MQGGQYPQGRYVQGQQQKPDDSMNRRLLLVSQEKNPLKREKLVKVFTASLFNRWEALRKAIENVDYANDPGLALYMRHTPKEIAKNGNPVSDPYFKIVSEQGESAALVSPVQFDPREIDALQMLDYKWAEERKAIKRVRKDQYIKNQQQDVSFGS
ncbi:hypothetical protein GNI_054160 [Gregarina niphandrodes]|uniref:Uncharacterized protein n=1 Tax=Gregarina niphandrodes TaxID=110365 RepID=A0A023B913_GRENI|nr:hypothetical protein GNI_054160 [Gregarina niphandrodes]EZG70830.1 hypothetical protein GNI_054160 [Gregarina niphandrodes]|eukprot:XP_011129864.1 hypothetical protein GNI_054160 [Gregarina niphandrodes]